MVSVISYLSMIFSVFTGLRVPFDWEIALLILGWVMYTGLALKYGMLDFVGADPTGPFAVGYTNKYSTMDGNFCSVFYPTDEKHTNEVQHGYISGKN